MWWWSNTLITMATWSHMALTTLQKIRWAYTLQLQRALSVTAQWCIGHAVKMPRRVVSAPRSGVPRIGKSLAEPCQIHLLLELVSVLVLDVLANYSSHSSLLYGLMLILYTLHRIQQSAHRVLLVAPKSPSARPWFLLLLSLVVRTPCKLPPWIDLLSLMGWKIWHPQPGYLYHWVGPPGVHVETLLNTWAHSTQAWYALR